MIRYLRINIMRSCVLRRAVAATVVLACFVGAMIADASRPLPAHPVHVHPSAVWADSGPDAVTLARTSRPELTEESVSCPVTVPYSTVSMPTAMIRLFRSGQTPHVTDFLRAPILRI